MGLAVGVSWVFMHVLATGISGGMIVGNVFILRLLRKAIHNLTERKLDHGYVADQAHTNMTGAAVRIGNHVCLVILGMGSLTVGTEIVSTQFKQEQIWTCVLPLMILFNLSLVFHATSTFLGLIATGRILEQSYESPGISPLSENSSAAGKPS